MFALKIRIFECHSGWMGFTIIFSAVVGISSSLKILQPRRSQYPYANLPLRHSTKNVVDVRFLNDENTSPVLPTVKKDDSDGTAQSFFGTHDYWDEMYAGRGEFPADEYSWYFGWDVIRPFWEHAVPNRDAKVLCPGVGNDPSLLELINAGWCNVTAFDYSENAIHRQREILDIDPKATSGVALHCLDARELPEDWTDCFDAVFEKGALDAIYLSGESNVNLAAMELARVLRTGGVVVSFSGVVSEEVRRAAFPLSTWEWVRDGSEDLRAGCFVLRKKGQS